ncbi:hypothetical protein GOP47_0020427 [Adiantum capillus-veneris]|uniref:DYW domain-containing protein n=1 Tax=Adiantum capillus-veneris TaxID=13818 RepID=A0A9D4UDH3_ADICA|nr:hypothetical protein GOP47_0020427 [Adiantum capillus-veneris]
MAMALVPSPLSTSSKQPLLETHLHTPLQTPGSWTSTDNLSSRVVFGKAAPHFTGGIFSERRDHIHPLGEVMEPPESASSAGNSPLPAKESGGASTQNEHEVDARSVSLLDAAKVEDSQASFQEKALTRESIIEHLSRQTFELAEGMLLHSILIESGLELKTFEENILMNMYGKFGAVEDACFLFHHMQQPNVISWNTLMSAYLHQKYFFEVLELFSEMHQEGFPPDLITLTIALRSCAGLAAFSEGRLIHYLVVIDGLEAEISIGPSLILMYTRCGAWKEARFMFDNMLERDDFTWTIMILACFDHGHYEDTLRLYRQMQQEGRVPSKVILLSALKSCTNLSDLVQGKLIHKYIADSAFAYDEELAGALVAMYGQCRATDLARSVFESIRACTVTSYNTMMGAYLSKRLHRNAFLLLNRMLEDGLIPHAAIYSKAVQACEGYAALEDVRDFHSHVIMSGLDSEVMMGTAVVSMYCKCGEIAEARSIFSQMKVREVLAWNVLLATCVQLQRPYECIEVFEEMLRDGIDPSKEAFSCVLSSCAHLGALEKGKIIHANVIEAELELDAVLGSALINMYGKGGAVEDAHCVFDDMHDSNVIHWTSMIAGYVRQGRARDALQLFDKMQQERVKPNSITFTNVLNACASLGALTEGQMIHVSIKDSELKVDAGLANALLHMYCKCGSLKEARLVFEDIVHKKTVSWNVLIAAYIEQDQYELAIQLFQQMQKQRVEADEITFVSILRACACLEDLELGKEIHSYVVQRGLGSGIIFATTLIRMYGGCGALQESHWVFDEIKEHNVVSWTSLMTVYAQQGHGEEAIELFHQMRVEGWEPDHFTLVSVLGAYASLKLSAPDDVVQACFKCNFKSDVQLGNALINMYAKCSAIKSAESIFEKMRGRSVVTWNTMISAYGQHGFGKEALELLQRAHQEGISPDELTWCHCLSICADLGSLGQGKLIHRGIVACGYEANVGLGNAMISMYGKCGAMEEAVFVFNSIQRDVVSWNAILATLSQHGFVEKVVQTFRRMRVEGIKPDEVTFLSVLNTCRHAGLVEDGCDFFKWMRDSLKSVLTINHYGCLIDLFGKSGHLDVAEDLICTVPFYTNALLWMTLLGSCRNHSDLERGERALDYVARLDPGNAAPYVLMSNIYATHGRWADVKMLREVMLKKGIQKRPGVSTIEVNNRVHSFLPRDMRHPDRHAIYKKLEILNQELKAQGYVPDTRLALGDADEESKKYLLCHHSERLALAFGLIRTPSKEPLLIVKSLRMCADCHAAFKLLSTIVDREITVRDARRFHCFSKGLCSCGDYW